MANSNIEEQKCKCHEKRDRLLVSKVEFNLQISQRNIRLPIDTHGVLDCAVITLHGVMGCRTSNRRDFKPNRKIRDFKPNSFL